MKNLELKCDVQNNITEIIIDGQRFNDYKGYTKVPEYADCKVTWANHGDFVSCKYSLSLNADIPMQETYLKVLIPYPCPPNPLKVWTAMADFPQDIYYVGGRHIYYGDVTYGTMIPAVTLYDQKKNIGLTVCKAFGRTGGRLSFNFGTYHEEGLEIEFSRLALKKGETVEIELFLIAHDGCYRPGLKWIVERYREYFEPVNKNIYQHHKAFAITNPFTNAALLDRFELGWSEIHNHFPYYGDYAPDEEEWDSVVLHDYPELKDEIPGKISAKRINDHIAELHKRNCKAMLYIQCSGDGLIPWAEKNFPDSIARDSAGNLIPTWKECCFMNGDPSTSFGKFISRKIDRFLSIYPDIDGIFLDQLCYQCFDYAQHDGKSADGERPVYEYGLSYEYNVEKISRKLHDANKFIWANGPFDIEAGRYVDGVMSEGTSGISETHKYLTLAKPLLIHTYPTDDFKVESMLRYCMLAGASWSYGGSSTKCDIPEYSDEIKELFAQYLPLLEPFNNTVVLLEPAPFKLPFGYKGEIFADRTDESKTVLTCLGNRVIKTIAIEINLEHADSALVRGNNDTEWKTVYFDGNTLTFDNHSSAYTIIFNRTR